MITPNKKMVFEAVLLRWILWTLVFAILFGGVPWVFP